MAYTFITIASLHYVSIKNYFIAVLFYFYCSCASGLRHADSRWQCLSSASSVLLTVIISINFATRKLRSVVQ